MFQPRFRLPMRLASATALCIAALTAAAQPAAGTSAGSARPDPLDPRASVPKLLYRSSFGAVPAASAAADGKAITWREANDTVTRIGGWRVYAREAQPAASAASAASGARKP